MKKEITLIGAGLVGSLLSVYLTRRGYRVSLYERRSDIRKSTYGAGRSINLALSDRGIAALQELGIMDDIKAIGIPMYGRFIHNADGSTAYQPYGEEGQCIHAVSRLVLNQHLMNLAEANGATIHFNEKCEGIDWQKKEAIFHHQQQPQTTAVRFERLIASDGAFSAGRLSHQLQQDRFQYEQFYIDFGYKELTIPAGSDHRFQLEKNALHIWPRGNFMLIALPNLDGSFTCTLFFPFEGAVSFASLDTPEKVQSFFHDTFADATALMPGLVEEYFNNPTGSLVTVKCSPWVREDYFALIGDAAHAIVPFFGQGMNCGFEDCRVLNQLLDIHKDDWAAALPEYQRLRKPDGDAIATLALNNFVEMRDKVADPQFLLQKKIEAAFSKKHPDKWTPAYAQVTFSPHIRYSEALQNSIRQEAIMQQIMAMPNLEQDLEQGGVEEKMLSLLST